MWLVTPIGFFSIVQKPGDKRAGTLTVRARVRGDLLALKQHHLPGLGPVTETSDTDYRFRATAPRSEVSAALARMVDELSYSNFKSEVEKRQGHVRAKLYQQVWSVLFTLQTDPAFKDKGPSSESYGGVVVSGGNRVLLRESSQQHGGYTWTFAKTEARAGESPQETALRAVREKTGYGATIRAEVQGLFKGSASATRYFLMEASHPPRKAGWQTAQLRWVKFDEARELIGQSPNAKGRARDLAILDAAERAVANIPYREHARVQPEDWELLDMPERFTTLYPRLSYTARQMAMIQRGFFPTVMEQKWFMYFTADRLRMHRSWGGTLIYDVGFRFDPAGGASITEVVVNRDPEQYGNTNDEKDVRLIEELIQGHLLAPLEAPAIDGFVQGAMLASNPNYLGRPAVVSGLVSEIFDLAVRVIKSEATAVEQQAVVSKVIAAFTSDEAGYSRMPGWHTAEQMGAHVRKYLVGSGGALHEGESLASILGSGFSALLEKFEEMLRAYLEDPSATWQEHALVQLNELQDYAVAVLLGTNKLSCGERTLGDFHWTTVAAGGINEKHCIVKLAGEGGEIGLFGIRAIEGWMFRVECDESALSDLIDNDDSISVVERPWVSTWRSALRQLDAYPWMQMQPLEVHSDFCSKVRKALQIRQKKGMVIPWDEWQGVLELTVPSKAGQKETGQPVERKEGPTGLGVEWQVDKAEGRPILSSLNVTTDLLRKLVSNALDRRRDFLEGKIEGSVAQARNISESRDLAELFMGRGPMAADYFVQPWNSADQLGRSLVEAYEMECQPDESVFTALIELIVAVYKELDYIKRNKLDIEEHGWRFDGLIEMFAHALTGIPYPPME